MGIFDNLKDGIRDWIFGDDLYGIVDERVRAMQERRNYREGRHKPQIRPKPGKTDDNVYINFSGLVIDRSVSMLFGNGVEFDLPGEGDDTPEDLYLADLWEANKQDIFLHRWGLLASEDGTGYIKIVRDGVIGKMGVPRARLVLVDPKWVTMDTNPEDFEEVIRYTIRFDTVGPDGKKIARKQVHEIQDNNTWLISDYMSSSATGGKWVLMQQEPWEYEFPQILHHQNLPAPDNIYGTPDLTGDLLELQDKLNFVASNINKIIRLHAHPKNILYGFGTDNRDVLSLDIGEAMTANNADAWWKTVELQSDLKSSADFFLTLRQAFFDVARTVDIDSIGDKLGALTNFGLKVLYQDAINKIHTKQRLYGDALLELNRRLLVIGELNPDPGEIIWPEALPENGLEESQEYQTDIDMGILSKQTAAIKKGYDWEQEQERIQDERAQGENIGNMLVNQFFRGGNEV